MLVLIGATPEGKKELIGFQVGVRESAQSWHELLVETKSRGLKIAPEIAVGDGALGFRKALDEVFPATRIALLERFWQARHPPRYAAYLIPSSPSFPHSSECRGGPGASHAVHLLTREGGPWGVGAPPHRKNAGCREVVPGSGMQP